MAKKKRSSCKCERVAQKRCRNRKGQLKASCGGRKGRK